MRPLRSLHTKESSSIKARWIDPFFSYPNLTSFYSGRTSEQNREESIMKQTSPTIPILLRQERDSSTTKIPKTPDLYPNSHKEDLGATACPWVEKLTQMGEADPPEGSSTLLSCGRLPGSVQAIYDLAWKIRDKNLQSQRTLSCCSPIPVTSHCVNGCYCATPIMPRTNTSYGKTEPTRNHQGKFTALGIWD